MGGPVRSPHRLAATCQPTANGSRSGGVALLRPIAVGPSAILTGSRTRPSDWGSNARFGPVEDRRNNRRLAAFTCTLCVRQIRWLSPFSSPPFSSRQEERLGQTEFQVNLKLGLTQCPPDPGPRALRSRALPVNQTDDGAGTGSASPQRATRPPLWPAGMAEGNRASFGPRVGLSSHGSPAKGGPKSKCLARLKIARTSAGPPSLTISDPSRFPASQYRTRPAFPLSASVPG